MDLYTLGIAFVTLIIYQTIAKKFQLPVPSNGLEYVKDRAIEFFEWTGYTVSKMLNIMEFIEFFTDILTKIWDFIVDHVWSHIRPVVESVTEIVSPLWKLFFSWGYFFIGFAKVNFVLLSYIGGGCVVSVVMYFTHPYWHVIYYSYGGEIIIISIVMFVGLIIAFPNILCEIFTPITTQTNSFISSLKPVEESITVNGEQYFIHQLRKYKLSQLSQLLEEAGTNSENLPRTKYAYINRLQEHTA